MQNVGNVKWALNNGQQLHAIGFGGVDFRPDEDAVTNVFLKAIDAGYRHIDSASIYKNERQLGRAIKLSKVPREEFFITTKVWNTDIREDRMEKAFEESLERLELDYVDSYLIHWPIAGRLVSSWKTMEKIAGDKRTLSIGVCNYYKHHLMEILAGANVQPVMNQLEFHPWLQQREQVEYCQQRNILVQAWKPLGGGPTLNDRTIKAVAEKRGRTTAQIILRWAFQRGVATIPHSENAERIVSNTKVFDFELSSDEMQQLNNLESGRRQGAHPDNFNF